MNRSIAFPCSFLVLGLSLLFLTAEAQDTAPQTTGQKDRLAIVKSIEGYLDAMNRQAAQQAASYWSQSGEWICDDGRRIRGTEAIAEEMNRLFQNDPAGVNVSLRDVTIRFITRDVSIEDGIAIVSVPGEEPTESNYSAVHVRQNGIWKIDSIRETLFSVSPTRSSKLDDLSWLIGDWVDQADGDFEIKTSCRWTEGNKAIRRSFTVSNNQGQLGAGTQVIVWDARLGKIRSWIFDSNGGFGNGTWENTGDSQWTVDAQFQSADGGLTQSSQIYSKITQSSLEFQSTNRILDGVEMPASKIIRIMRLN